MYVTIAIIAAAIVAILVVVQLAKSAWQVAEPNEALIISGAGIPKDADGNSFRTVVGGGAFVMPGVQIARRLSLGLRQAQLSSNCVTKQGVNVIIVGICMYKIGDDKASITNAARRFLSMKDDDIDKAIQSLFDGHLRSIIGGLTVEQLISDREALTGQTRDAASGEMQKLGLIIDSLQIQDFKDPSNYIAQLAIPHIASAKQAARVAQAQADQAATQAEQESEAIKAQATRDAEIKKAGFQAEIDRAKAESAQQGPLADAKAQQQVIIEQTKIAQLDADRKEQELQVEVRKPADAAAYATKVAAEAARDAAISQAQADAQRTTLEAEASAQATIATGNAEANAAKARGLAEAEATKAKLTAEADGIKARAEALATNQEAVINQTIAELIPSIVEKAAAPFANIKSLNVLDGGEGLNRNVGGIIATAVGMLPIITQGLRSVSAAAKDLRTSTADDKTNAG